MTRTFETVEQASAAFCAARDASGKGGSQWPNWTVRVKDRTYRISYNGKVWADEEWSLGAVPLFNPYSPSHV